MSSLVLSTFLVFAKLVHVGHIAEYYYTYDGSKVNLKFVIEKEELLGFDISDDCDIKVITALCTIKYLEQNSSMKINNQETKFELLGSETEGDHLNILMASEQSFSEINEVSIQNSCFVAFNKEFKNRIILNLGKFQKSFLLTKEKDFLSLN